jgi:hypothetical protein
MGFDGLTVCMTCRLIAHEAEDGCFLGIPDMSAELVQFEGGRQNFGFFHHALEHLGFMPHEMHAYGRFLSRHGGHEVDVWDINALNEEHPDLPLREDPEDEAIEEVPSGWALGVLELMCKRCAKRRRTKEPVVLRTRPELRVQPETVDTLLGRVVSLWDDNFYRYHPGGRRSFAVAMSFLESHRGHDIRSRVVTDTTEESAF